MTESERGKSRKQFIAEDQLNFTVTARTFTIIKSTSTPRTRRRVAVMILAVPMVTDVVTFFWESFKHNCLCARCRTNHHHYQREYEVDEVNFSD